MVPSSGCAEGAASRPTRGATPGGARLSSGGDFTWPPAKSAGRGAIAATRTIADRGSPDSARPRRQPRDKLRRQSTAPYLRQDLYLPSERVRDRMREREMTPRFVALATTFLSAALMAQPPAREHPARPADFPIAPAQRTAVSA